MRIATLFCRGIGWLTVILGSACFVLAWVTPEDRIGPIIGGMVTVLVGVAFLVAKPITAEDLASGIRDL